MRVASFGVTPGAGTRVCARLFGYQRPGKDIPAIAARRARARLDLADNRLAEAAAGVKHAIEISKKFESADSRVGLLDLQLEIHAALHDNTAGEAVARELEKIVVERGHALNRSEVRSALTHLVRFWTRAGQPADAARATAQFEKLDAGR